MILLWLALLQKEGGSEILCVCLGAKMYRGLALVVYCLAALLSGACYQGGVLASGNPKVLRGISPEDRDKYKAAVNGKEFTCLSSGEVLDISALNDNYCDCEDGSDEPGTSACPNGKFYCKNKNYKPKTISSMFVDDGVCDCCDGSDEEEGCKNTCKEDGAALRKELEDTIRDVRQGLMLKGKMLSGNEINKEEIGQKVAVMEKKINATGILVQKLEARIKVINDALLEEKTNKILEDKAADASESEGEGEGEGEDEDYDEEEYDEMMKDDEGAEETDEDIGRKIASRWTRDPDAAAAQSDSEGAGEEGEASGGARGGKPENWDDEEDGPWEAPPKEEGDEFDFDTFEKEAETIEGDGDLANKETESFISIFKKGLHIVKNLFEKSEHAKVQDELEKQRKELNRMKEELKRMENLLTFDFGEGNRFLPFYGECFSKVIEKYTYKICPFDNAKQDHTNLGEYKGLGDDQKSLRFADGTGCWNGPKRSIVVNLRCGLKNDILKVEEPNVCEYVASFSTPLVCETEDLESKTKEYQLLTGDEFHDEL